MNEAPSVAELDREGITDSHRVLLANCIMEWATCESHLRALLTSLEGRSLDLGALDYSRTSPEESWTKIIKLLRKKGTTQSVLDAVQHNRASSRAFYDTRKLIVHAGCPGVWSKNPEYLLFAPFEAREPGALIIAWVPLTEIRQSATYARATTNMVQKIMDTLGY